MRWEYKIISVQAGKWTSTGLPDELGELFDKYGGEGWELVRIEPILQSGWFVFGCGTTSRTESLIAFFKRPKT